MNGSHLLWYRRPAAVWEEALPVGNGQIGAMVFGGVAEERLQLNEKSLWSGGPYDADNPEALPALGRIRELLFAGKYAEAEALTRSTQVCRGKGSNLGDAPRSDYGCYQTLGDLRLAFSGLQAKPAEYRRELDLDQGIARVSFRDGGRSFAREVFASATHRVLVTRLTTDTPGAIDVAVTLQRVECARTAPEGDSALWMTGRMFWRGEAIGRRFAAKVLVLAEGGTCRAEGSSLRVVGATAVTLLVAAATDELGDRFEADAEARIAHATTVSFADLRAAHLEQHRALYRRVALDLGAGSSSMPTDERLARAADGERDPSLTALYAHLGRYLLIASSRAGSLAANLQGIWADGTQTPWNCDYHTNINVQMNYWLAETGNLGECAEPLVALIDRMREPGRRTAQVHYGARGWVVHTLHNAWGYTAPGEEPSWGLSPMAGPWLCQHLWERFAFSRDLSFLRRVFPILRESAEFCLDWLVEDPRTGKLVSGPAPSPENAFFTPGGERCTISMAPSMDQEILWDHFTNVIEAAHALGVAGELGGFVDQVRAARDRLAMPRIGGDGRLLEWAEEHRETEPEHRHVSHLFALHPGRQITAERTPELAEAARKTLRGRGDGGTGWSMAWKVCFWARLGDGDHAAALLDNLVFPCDRRASGAGVYPNLFCAHPPYQIDGNLGGAAGILEMLVQSHDGAIALLPALPRRWPAGSLRGVAARGGFEVDVLWGEGELAQAEVRCLVAGPCVVRYRGREVRRALAEGERWLLARGAFSP